MAIKGGKTMYSKPILPGMRICLNPESDRFQELKTYTENTGGYVVHFPTLVDQQIIHLWKEKKHIIDSTYIVVVFDNHIEHHYQLLIKDILPIDNSPNVNVKTYYLSDDTFYITINNKNNILDKKVIEGGISIYNTCNYDDEWREKILKKINEE